MMPIQQALAMLLQLLEEEVEYPEAEMRVFDEFGISVQALREAYDRHCEEGGSTGTM